MKLYPSKTIKLEMLGFEPNPRSPKDKRVLPNTPHFLILESFDFSYMIINNRNLVIYLKFIKNKFTNIF